MQSFILPDKVQLSDNTFCGSSVIVQGIEMGCRTFPLHRVHLQSNLCTDLVRVAVCPSLPVKGLILSLEMTWQVERKCLLLK